MKTKANSATRPAFTDATINVHKVAFSHNKEKSLDLQRDGLSVTSLIEFGAMLLTREYQPGIAGHVTKTDQKGLELAISSGEDIIEGVLRGISAVNKSLAFSAETLDGGDITEIGWLISSLSELAIRVQFGVSEFRHELKRDFDGKGSNQSEGRP